MISSVIQLFWIGRLNLVIISCAKGRRDPLSLKSIFSSFEASYFFSRSS